MRACVIIPARFASTRFPGKPLIPLLGKPMILWVAELSALAVGKDHVYVATENEQIAKVVESAGFSSLKTNPFALTGTDRLAEAAKMVDYDIYVNVQGDDPLAEPADIKRCIELKSSHPNLIINGFCWIGKDEEPTSINIPKVITTESGKLVYMSRRPLPGYKDQRNAPVHYKKQVCIYGFTREELAIFVGFGRKSALEACEDIEILRFLDLNREVMMYECSPGSLAVDVVEDVEKVEKILMQKHAS